jgi:type I restriction-modification system DNA methylase subunit
MEIKTEILSIIESGTTQNNLYFLPNTQLDRKTYLEVNKILEALGGKWNRKEKAHVFPENIESAIDDVVLTGEVDTPISEKKKYQFFETPVGLARQLVEMADISPGQFVLEPSAGSGRIAEAIRDAGVMPDCIELNPTLANELQDKGFLVMADDFLCTETKPLYDRVVMNPPFSRQQDIDHVSHALDCLKPGGILVAIMSPGIKFRQNKKTTAFLEKLDRYHHEITDLPAGAFKESGTMVKAIVLRCFL